MTKNEIFRKFLKNPELQEAVGMDEDKLMELDLSGIHENKLLEIIKQTILFTEREGDVDATGRRINQYFKSTQL